MKVQKKRGCLARNLKLIGILALACFFLSAIAVIVSPKKSGTVVIQPTARPVATFVALANVPTTVPAIAPQSVSPTPEFIATTPPDPQPVNTLEPAPTEAVIVELPPTEQPAPTALPPSTAIPAPVSTIMVVDAGPDAQMPTAVPVVAASNCDPAYSGVCIPSPPPDLNCDDLKQFGEIHVVKHPDPHRLDNDGDGLACAGN